MQILIERARCSFSSSFTETASRHPFYSPKNMFLTVEFPMTDEEPVDVNEVARHLNTLLKGSVSVEELVSDLDRYADRYLLDPLTAARAIFKDHGGDDADYIPMVTGTSRISDLTEGDEKTVSGVVRGFNGRRTTGGTEVMEFTISDGSGSVPVTVWRPVFDVTNGQTVTIVEPRMNYNTYHERLQLETEGVRVIATGDAPEEHVVTDCGELVVGDTGVIVQGTVHLAPSVSTNPKAPRQKGTLKLRRGEVEFSHWGDYDLENGCTYVFRNVRVGEFRGVKQVTFGKQTPRKVE